MKLLLIYYSGSEYDGCDETICIEYENEEALYIDFENIIKPLIEQFKKWAYDNEKFWKAQPNANHTKEYQIWLESRPKSPITSIKIFNYNFDIHNFMNGEYGYIPPEIIELNKWFEQNKVN